MDTDEFRIRANKLLAALKLDLGDSQDQLHSFFNEIDEARRLDPENVELSKVRKEVWDSILAMLEFQVGGIEDRIAQEEFSTRIIDDVEKYSPN